MQVTIFRARYAGGLLCALAVPLGAISGCGGNTGDDYQISELELALSEESICGTTLEYQDVELYDGTYGVSQNFVRTRQAPVGRHTRGCSGTLVSPDLFLSAGHCQYQVGDSVVFNHQVDGTNPPNLRTTSTFTVSQVVEQEWSPTSAGGDGWDYAIVRLSGSPGLILGMTAVTALDSAPGSHLTIIQHPNGDPKKVATGPLIDYSSTVSVHHYRHQVDTEGGSSGSGVLDTFGRLIGVHTNGGCNSAGGNSAMSMRRLALRSPTLRGLVSSFAAWTGFLSRDTPNATGDHESLAGHVADGKACENPIGINCRRKSDRKQSFQTGETVTCSLTAGFQCTNAQQTDGVCDDYEVSFLCPNSVGVTAWFDRDDPGGNGDFERLSDRVAENAACDHPVAAQCRRKSDGLDWKKTGEVLSCTPSYGVACENARQSDGRCDDYEIRYVCPTTGFWTPWRSRDTPNASGDHESFASHYGDGGLCPGASGIECRRRSDGADWTTTGDVMICNPIDGAVCRNNDQADGRCDDYEVRFFYADALGLCL